MGKAPSVIIIARHGARLDAEDANWQATSSTPYDPPLSYGGWTQTRALGGRIASLLHERPARSNGDVNPRDGHAPEESEAKASLSDGYRNSNTTPSRRKYRVVIHSSPFLRCIQSSIAISAGMAQFQRNVSNLDSKGDLSKPANSARLFTPPLRSQTLDSANIDAKYTASSARIRSKAAASQTDSSSNVKTQIMKPTLRVDAYLGEWLTSDYFEFITPPPSSQMMIAGAKVDLMRIGTPLRGFADQQRELPEPPPLELDSEDVTAPMSRSAVPEVAKEDGSTTNTPGSRHNSISSGYLPPNPNYPITPQAPIPPGYVAHARDACIKVDMQWDSQRPPQEWGDGGEYGEEWRSMHRRFRKGLMDMIKWYKEKGACFDPQAEDEDEASDGDNEDETDIALVIVTHGAGANALIGALTNQPVLLDVGMGSLTMAVRKETSNSELRQSLSRVMSSKNLQRLSSVASVDCSQAEEYEMQLTASTDHLRAGRDPLKIPILQSPLALASIIEKSRRSSMSASSVYSAPSKQENARNSSVGSVRRSRATTTSGSRTSFQDKLLSTTARTGLWGSGQGTTNNMESMTLAEEGEPSGPTVAEEGQATASPPQTPNGGAPMRKTKVEAPRNRANSQRGLWGGSQVKEPTKSYTVAQS